jgi:hypothetical protein
MTLAVGLGTGTARPQARGMFAGAADLILPSRNEGYPTPRKRALPERGLIMRQRLPEESVALL